MGDWTDRFFAIFSEQKYFYSEKNRLNRVVDEENVPKHQQPQIDHL